MDPEIPELGPGPEPADPAVRGADHAVFIEKEQAGAAVRSFRLLPPYSVGIYSIAGKFPPYSRGRVWAEPTKKGISANVLFPMQKIHSGCINKRILVIVKSEGRFDSRKFLKPTTNFYISNSYPGKHGLPKTQNFLHPSAESQICGAKP